MRPEKLETSENLKTRTSEAIAASGNWLMDGIAKDGSEHRLGWMKIEISQGVAMRWERKLTELGVVGELDTLLSSATRGKVANDGNRKLGVHGELHCAGW